MEIIDEQPIDMDFTETFENVQGGSGVSSYAQLTDKPKINGVTLVGNKSFADLGMNTVIDTEVESYVEEHKSELKGDPGQNGTDGQDGEDGYSPSASVSQTMGGAVITITDKNGTTTATVTNGTNGYTPQKNVDYFDGEPGTPGTNGTNGTDGVSCTHSWSGTTLTVTSASGTSSADLKGETGADGENYSVSYIMSEETEVELPANTFVSMGTMSELYISLGDPVADAVLSEYMFSFISGETATDFSYDVSSITFIDEPDIQSNTIYQGSVVDGIAIMVGLTYE